MSIDSREEPEPVSTLYMGNQNIGKLDRDSGLIKGKTGSGFSKNGRIAGFSETEPESGSPYAQW